MILDNLTKSFLDQTQYIDPVMSKNYKYIVCMENCTLWHSQCFYTNDLRNALNRMLKELFSDQINVWISLTNKHSFHGLHVIALKEKTKQNGAHFCKTLLNNVMFNHQLVFE